MQRRLWFVLELSKTLLCKFENLHTGRVGGLTSAPKVIQVQPQRESKKFSRNCGLCALVRIRICADFFWILVGTLSSNYEFTRHIKQLAKRENAYHGVYLGAFSRSFLQRWHQKPENMRERKALHLRSHADGEEALRVGVLFLLLNGRQSSTGLFSSSQDAKSAVSMLTYVQWYLQRPKYSRWRRDPHYADAPFSRCPRVRVRCPRLRSTLTLSGQVQSAAGLAALFTGKEVQGKAGIGAGGEVTGELVSGNRHHAYSVDSGQTSPRDNCHPALARGQCSPNKSLHTS